MAIIDIVRVKAPILMYLRPNAYFFRINSKMRSVRKYYFLWRTVSMKTAMLVAAAIRLKMPMKSPTVKLKPPD